MDAVLEPFPADRLFPGSSFLDLGDLNEADFLSNAHFPEHLEHFSENMEDFSNDLFSSFFDDPILAEKNPLLDMELDPPTPGIQAEHSYSLSGDSAPQSPLIPVKTEDSPRELEHGAWALGHKLCAIMVKQEQNVGPELPGDQLAAPSPVVIPGPVSTASADMPMFNLNLGPLSRLPAPHEAPGEMIQTPVIKAEPREVNHFLEVPTVPQHLDSQQEKLQGTSGPLLLTEEEKRTLIAEGYPIPTKLPLTKAEEKALKRVRRKIKNKISAQESRRKKKEYVECLEKKVETFTSENNELWKKVETLENANRTLLQQLQKLQALVTGKVSRPYKMAATQTGTCIMVVVLCFVLVLGSIMPCLPEFSSMSQTVKETPLPAASVYTASQMPSRSLLFYDEGASSLEDGYSSLLPVESQEGWETKPGTPEEQQPQDHLSHGHLATSHEATKYLSKSQLEAPDGNDTRPDFIHPKERFHESRETHPNGTTTYL